MKLEVGQVIPQLKGTGDSVRFGMSDAGAELLVCFRSPTEAEIQTIKKGPIRFGMFTKENIIFILLTLPLTLVRGFFGGSRKSISGIRKGFFYTTAPPLPACVVFLPPVSGHPKIILANFYGLIRHSKYIRFAGVKLAFYTFDYEVARANDMIAL